MSFLILDPSSVMRETASRSGAHRNAIQAGSHYDERRGAALQRLYEWSAEVLGEPRLLGLVRDGSPIYAWPYEQRPLWRTQRLPSPGQVLERLTRSR
jgi:hypothetical protein